MKKPVLVVLAAGMGSRYGGLKQMDAMGGHGQVIIDYSIYDAKQAGFDEVIFIIKRSIEKDFKELVGDRIAHGMKVRYAYQELDDLPEGYSVPEGREKPWGTTHAMLAARDLVDGPFVIINADDYYGRDAFKTIYEYLIQENGPTEHAMVGYRLGNTVTDYGSVARGVCRMDKQGFLADVVERTSIEKEGDGGRFSEDGGNTWNYLPGDTLVSMNFWGFQKSFMDESLRLMPEYLDKILAENPTKGEVFLPLIVDRLTKANKATVKVLSSNDKWYGVTYKEDKPSVIAAIAKMTADGVYPENLWGI